jgi:hypothetical protein
MFQNHVSSHSMKYSSPLAFDPFQRSMWSPWLFLKPSRCFLCTSCWPSPSSPCAAFAPHVRDSAPTTLRRARVDRCGIDVAVHIKSIRLRTRLQISVEKHLNGRYIGLPVHPVLTDRAEQSSL